VCCQVEVSATCRSPYRLRGVVLCDLETSRRSRTWPALGCSAAGGEKNQNHMDWISYELEWQGFESREEQDIFLSSPKRPDRLWGRLSLPFNGYRDSSQGVKRPGREVNYSSPSSAEVRNKRSYTFTPAICLHGEGRENVLRIVLEELFKEFPTLYGTKVYYRAQKVLLLDWVLSQANPIHCTIF